MPTYEFKCPECGKVEEFEGSVKEMLYLTPPYCLDCKRWMQRKYGMVGISWHCSRPSPYSKGDKEKKMEDVSDD